MAFPYYSGALFGGENEGYEAAVSDSTFMFFAVEGMTCSGCEAAVNSVARQDDDVMKSEANYEEGTLLVEWKNYPPSDSSIQRIISDLENIGYHAELAKTPDIPAAESSEDE
jgi:cation transport ATPase